MNPFGMRSPGVQGEHDLELALGRLKSIDFMKGIGLIVMLFSHWSMWWTDGSWVGTRAFILLFTRFFGIPNFVIMSIIGLLLSINGKEQHLGTRGQLGRMLKRVGMFLMIGAINNIIYVGNNLLIPSIPLAWKILFVLFSCNVITFIGMAQFAIYFFKRLHVTLQIMIIASIIAAYYVFLPSISALINPSGFMAPEMLASNPTLITYTFFFMENTMAPLVPALAWPLLACVVYSRFAAVLANKSIVKGRMLKELRIVQLASLGIMVLGILMGITLTTGIVSNVFYNDLAMPGVLGTWTAPGYPLFLHLTHPSYMFFSFGALSLLLSMVFEVVDVRVKWTRLPGMLGVFGRFTLTIYLLNPIASFFPIPIDFPAFLIVFSLATSLTILGTIAWDNKWKGKFSVDWCIKKIADSDIRAVLQATSISIPGKRKRWNVF
jgi:hypothetical protein